MEIERCVGGGEIEEEVQEGGVMAGMGEAMGMVVRAKAGVCRHKAHIKEGQSGRQHGSQQPTKHVSKSSMYNAAASLFPSFLPLPSLPLHVLLPPWNDTPSIGILHTAHHRISRLHWNGN